MSGNAPSPSYLSNNVNFNRTLPYNGSPVIKGNLRPDPSLNENSKGSFGQFDHMRHIMGRSFPAEMCPSQRYGLPSTFKSDFTSHGYNFSKFAPQDEFMNQGYQQGFKMPCNEFLPYSQSDPQMMPASQSFPSLSRHNDVQYSSESSAGQGTEKFSQDNRPSAMSPAHFYMKASKCGEPNMAKKPQDNLSSEDMSTDSDVSGSNLSRSGGASRPSTPNRGMHPTPPSTGCSSSRPSTPSQPVGLMPPPLNPSQQGQSRVFSPVAANPPGFYSPHFHMGGFNRSGGSGNVGQEHPQFGGFSYPLHSPPMMRQHSYRMREPHFTDIRHYSHPTRMMDPSMNSRFESDQEFLRHNYRHGFLPARVPQMAMMYGQMGDFPPRASFENYNSSHDSSIPSNTGRKLHGDHESEKSAFERNYLQKHGSYLHQMPNNSVAFPASSKGPHFRDETVESQKIHVSSSSSSAPGKYQMTRTSKHSVEGEEFGGGCTVQSSFHGLNTSNQDSSSRPPWNLNKETLRQRDDFDDHSSTQDTLDENKHTSDSLITDESNTSDTMLSYPGASLQAQNENSNVEEPMAESPHKKLKQDFSQRPFQDNHRFSQNEAFCKLMEMGKEPDRQHFLQDLFSFMENKQMPIVAMPTVSKQPIDLFRLYCAVRKHGGMVEVTKEKKWRDVSSALNMGPSSSAGFVLKKNYGKYLFPYECYHDQGNIDPLPILAHLEQPIKKTGKKSEGSNFDNVEFQNSPKSHESLAPMKVHQSQGPQAVVPSGTISSSGHYNHSHSTYIPDSTFPSQGYRYSRQTALNSSSTYEPLHMICPSSSPSVKIEKRVIGSHIQKELLFPSSSIESIRPRCVKRKRLNLKQLGQVDAWRVIMSLKSGLVCESSWALNVLTGLLGDDVTFPFFCLQSMPGLIETLLDHFRASLIALFEHKFKDLELDWSVRGDYYNFDSSCKALKSGCRSNDLKDVMHHIEDGAHLSKKEKYRGKILLEKNLNEEKWLSDKKLWDCEGHGEFESSAFDWHLGRGDCSNHVLLNVESTDNQDFIFQKYFGKNRFAFLKSREKGNDPDGSETKECSIKDEDKSLEEIDPPLLDCKDFQSMRTKSNLVAPETSSCNHKLCRGLSECHPKTCLRDLFFKDRDNWYGTESRRENDSNFNLFSEAFHEQERRCLQVSNIFRSLSFVPGNDVEMSKHAGLLVILARLLLLDHEHELTNERATQARSQPSLKEAKCTTSDLKMDQFEWCQDAREGAKPSRYTSKTVETLREDALVILANISGQLDLSIHADEICTPILDGILHWMTCYTAAANDCNAISSMGHVEPGCVMPSFGMLALETSSKLCILDSNIDLLLAMPPFSRIVSLIHRLFEFLSIGAVGDHPEDDSPSWMSDQIAREFSLVILSSLVQSDPVCANVLAVNKNVISTLLNFIEVQCMRMHMVASPSMPPSYNCSPDMLKRAVIILQRVSQAKGKDESERHSLLRYKDRLLDLLCHKLPKSNFLTSMVGDVLSFSTF